MKRHSFPCKRCGSLTGSKYGYCQNTRECKAAQLREIRKQNSTIRKQNNKYNARRLKSSYDSIDVWVKRKIYSWRHQAKERGIEFSITVDDVPLSDNCAVTGIPFDLIPRGKVGYVANTNHPSLDRINGNQGYVPGNVRLVLSIYNSVKGALEHYNANGRKSIATALIADMKTWDIVQSEYEEKTLDERHPDEPQEVEQDNKEQMVQVGLW